MVSGAGTEWKGRFVFLAGRSVCVGAGNGLGRPAKLQAGSDDEIAAGTAAAGMRATGYTGTKQTD